MVDQRAGVFFTRPSREVTSAFIWAVGIIECGAFCNKFEVGTKLPSLTKRLLLKHWEPFFISFGGLSTLPICVFSFPVFLGDEFASTFWSVTLHRWTLPQWGQWRHRCTWSALSAQRNIVVKLWLAWPTSLRLYSKLVPTQHAKQQRTVGNIKSSALMTMFMGVQLIQCSSVNIFIVQFLGRHYMRLWFQEMNRSLTSCCNANSKLKHAFFFKTNYLKLLLKWMEKYTSTVSAVCKISVCMKYTKLSKTCVLKYTNATEYSVSHAALFNLPLWLRNWNVISKCDFIILTCTTKSLKKKTLCILYVVC